MSYRVGIDVGGTFTDLVSVGADGEFFLAKTPSTPQNQSEGIFNGLAKIAEYYELPLQDLLQQTDIIVHGTTVATNTMLEHNGALTGMITTKGFRDELELRRGWKENVFDVKLPAPYPIVPRRQRLTVEERIDYRGDVITALDEEDVRLQAEAMKAMGVQSAAICFINSYANPDHERRALEIVSEIAEDLYVVASSDILPQVREFERFSTTVVSAYVGPRLKAYLTSLQQHLQESGFGGQLMIMQSSGGMMTTDYTGDQAVNALMSGPAGGVSAAVHMGELTDYKDIITVDMGGTSYDVCLIKDRRPTIGSGSWVARHRVAVPMIDVHSIGAGGGSIAWIDAGGALKVGPQSAGADPGPACYDQGGDVPTVTDADLILGYLNPDSFAGSGTKMRSDLAEKAIHEHIASPLGMDTVEAAYGIFRIVNANMSNGIRVVSVEKGHDPRQFVLAAFGGAGAVHAGVQAEDLGIPLVVVPKWAGVFSAAGDLLANVLITETRTFFSLIQSLDLAHINDVFEEMTRDCEANLPEHGLNGVELRRQMDLRYSGEVHEVSVPLRGRARRISEHNVRATVADFHELHEQLYGYRDPESPVEVVNLKVDVIGLTETPRLPTSDYAGEDPSPALKGTRKAYFEVKGGFVETSIYDGDLMRYGNVLRGPAIVEESHTTIVVYPDQEMVVDRNLNYLIEIPTSRS